jgi:glycosyltransferase involved in cell wall biosynthesis
MNQTNTILRQATRRPDEPLNILTFASHERYEPNLCKTGHNFYSFYGGHNIKGWNTKYAPVPENYILIDINKPIPNVNYDLLLCHNPFVHLPLALQLSKQMGLPILSVMHTTPTPNWTPENYQQSKNIFDIANHTVFITEFNRVMWAFPTQNTDVIYHGIESDVFYPAGLERQPYVLSVANDYINRNWALGFNLYKEVIIDNNLPRKHIGDTPGFSKPCNDLTEIVKEYNKALVFVNTSLHSPVPMSLLEAMSCGCAVVTTNTSAIPDIIVHGKNGFLVPPHKPHKMKEYIEFLFTHPDVAKSMGEEARKTVVEKFSMKRFVGEWNFILRKVANETPRWYY